MAEWTYEEGKQAMNEAVRRSATDPGFRKLMLTNVNKAVEQVAGKPVPPQFKIRVLEKQGTDMTLILPDPVKAGGELSDKELEQVAGGGRCVGTCVVSCGYSSVL